MSDEQEMALEIACPLCSQKAGDWCLYQDLEDDSRYCSPNPHAARIIASRAKLREEPTMSDNFYRRLDAKEQENRLARLFKNRPDNLHDYQGCANDAKLLVCGCVGDCEGHNETGPAAQLREEAKPSLSPEMANLLRRLRTFCSQEPLPKKKVWLHAEDLKLLVDALEGKS